MFASGVWTSWELRKNSLGCWPQWQIRTGGRWARRKLQLGIISTFAGPRAQGVKVTLETHHRFRLNSVISYDVCCFFYDFLASQDLVTLVTPLDIDLQMSQPPTPRMEPLKGVAAGIIHVKSCDLYGASRLNQTIADCMMQRDVHCFLGIFRSC